MFDSFCGSIPPAPRFVPAVTPRSHWTNPHDPLEGAVSEKAWSAPPADVRSPADAVADLLFNLPDHVLGPSLSSVFD